MNKAEYQEESALGIQGGLGNLAPKAKNVWKLLVLPGLTCPLYSNLVSYITLVVTLLKGLGCRAFEFGFGLRRVQLKFWALKKLLLEVWGLNSFLGIPV